MHKDSIRTDSSPTHLSEEPDFAGAGVAGGLEGGNQNGLQILIIISVGLQIRHNEMTLLRLGIVSKLFLLSLGATLLWSGK